MNSGGEDLDDIFEEYENADNDPETNNENGQTTTETSAVRIAPPKRIVKNPRLKFNPERLCGKRGIPVLMDHFKDVKFKGVGHEKEDLDKLLSKLEHWTHRLFPSMKFQDCLVQIEKLGKKRPVQTCLRKIRLDMPIQDSDFVKDDEDNVLRNDDPEPEEIDPFDRLIGENQVTSNFNVSSQESGSDLSSAVESPVPNNFGGHILGSSFGSSVTEEQRERMERNRMLAAERRKARLAALQQAESQCTKTHETVSSENFPSEQNSFDKLLSSSFINQTTAQSTSSMSAIEISIDTEDVVKTSTCLPSEQNSFDCMSSSSINQENAQEHNNDSAIEISYSSEENKTKTSTFDLHSENSENLEMDDLLDLVNEDDFNNVDKTNKSQITIKNSDENDKSLVLDINEVPLSKISNDSSETNLEIVPLLDLVNDNSKDSVYGSESSLMNEAGKNDTSVDLNGKFNSVDK